MDDMILNVSTLPEPLHRRFRSDRVRVHEENGVIMLTPVDAVEEQVKGKVLKSRGIFHECANPEMIPGEKGAWERAVVERYAANYHS